MSNQLWGLASPIGCSHTSVPFTPLGSFCSSGSRPSTRLELYCVIVIDILWLREYKQERFPPSCQINSSWHAGGLQEETAPVKRAARHFSAREKSLYRCDAVLHHWSILHRTLLATGCGKRSLSNKDFPKLKRKQQWSLHMRGGGGGLFGLGLWSVCFILN